MKNLIELKSKDSTILFEDGKLSVINSNISMSTVNLNDFSKKSLNNFIGSLEQFVDNLPDSKE